MYNSTEVAHCLAMQVPLTNSLIALLGYAAWTFALLLAIAGWRTLLIVRERRAVNAFKPTGDDVSPAMVRLCRAHANCYENLPAFAALVVVAHASGHGAVTDPLALWVLAARCAQSSTHLVSTRRRAVLVRFCFFASQLVIQIVWIVKLARL
jgi:uncharacterized MAPEG superfamily protein